MERLEAAGLYRSPKRLQRGSAHQVKERLPGSDQRASIAALLAPWSCFPDAQFSDAPGLKRALESVDCAADEAR